MYQMRVLFALRLKQMKRCQNLLLLYCKMLNRLSCLLKMERHLLNLKSATTANFLEFVLKLKSSMTSKKLGYTFGLIMKIRVQDILKGPR